jgi:MYXO-CTERM domain-containing protein
LKNLTRYSGALALALLLTFAGSIIGGAGFATTAFAQEATVVPTVGAQEPTTQPAQPVDDNDGFPWGLLGLIGLAGLAGLRRQPEPVRQETGNTQSTVGVYDKKN